MQPITDLVYIDATGYHLADYQAFYDWTLNLFTSIYGADLYVDPDSMDGQFIAALAQAFYDTGALGGAVYNSFSPLTAQGYGLSRNVKINGLERLTPSYSTVTLTIVGVAGTVITGGIAQDTLDQKWNLPASVTIPFGGSVSVVASAQEIGQVFAEPNTVTKIFTPTNGWQTVNNSSAASVGNPVETDAQLRVRQSVSTSIPAETVLDATAGALANLPGTEENGVAAYDNDTGTDDPVTGIPAHTVCFVVASTATPEDICKTIQLYKTPGTGTYGSVTRIITDSRGMPVPISYQPASDNVCVIGVTVSIAAGTGWSSNSVALIKQAVANLINALPIGCGATIGSDGTFYYTTLFKAVYDAVPGNTFDVNAIEVGLNGGSRTADNIAIEFDMQPACNPAVDVTVNVV